MVQTAHTTKLEELLNPHRKEFNVLQTALAEVAEEESKDKIAKAKEFLKKAKDLQRQMNEAERQFNSSKKKWDKELGKVMSSLNRMASGTPEPDPDEKEEGKEGESE